MKSPNRKRWIITGLIAVLLVISPLIASKLLKELEAILTRGKRAHDAKAIVIRKEHVQFDEKNHFYINEDGVAIERRPGEEEWRVYYQITRFEARFELEQSAAIKLLRAEQERKAKGKQRYTILDKFQYDNIREGEEISVSWCGLGRSEIEIISAGKPVRLYPPPQN